MYCKINNTCGNVRACVCVFDIAFTPYVGPKIVLVSGETWALMKYDGKWASMTRILKNVCTTHMGISVVRKDKFHRS